MISKRNSSKTRQLALVFFMGILYFRTAAQSYESTNATILGVANIHSVGKESAVAFGNPSTPLSASKHQVSFFTNNQYLMKELTTVGIFIRKNYKKGLFSGGVHYLGTGNYNETRCNFGYSIPLNSFLRLGIAADFWRVGYREQIDNANTFTATPALWYKKGAYTFGVLAKNLGSGTKQSAIIQESLVVGMGYEKESIHLLVEVEKYINRKLLPRMAAMYQLHPKCSIQYGITFNSFNQHFGISYYSGKMRYEIAFYHQNKLGSSSSLAATYSE